MRSLLLSFAALALVSCDKTTVIPVADLSCGPTRLRFEVRRHETGFPAGAVSYTPIVSMNDGSGWTTVDDYGSHVTPYGYARLLPRHVDLRLYRVYEIGAYDWRLEPWAIYADPATITNAEYNAVSACVQANVPVLDAAFDRVPSDRRYRVASMLHVPHDDASLNLRWTCANGTYLQTEREDTMSICDGKPPCMSVAWIKGDAAALEFFKPPSDVYPQCRDSAGRPLSETFKITTRQATGRE